MQRVEPSPQRRAPQRRVPQRRTRRVVAGIALVVLAGLALAGCGVSAATDDVASLDGASGTTPPTTVAGSTDPEEAMRQYAACMREHGIDMADPTPAGSGGGGLILKGGDKDNPMDQSKLEAADTACQPLMAAVAQDARSKMDPAEEAKMREQALAFSQCMRDHGIDMPDPQFEDGGRVTQKLGPGDGSSSGVDPSSPAFEAAEKECSSLMPEGAMTSAESGQSGGGGGPGVGVSPAEGASE